MLENIFKLNQNQENPSVDSQSIKNTKIIVGLITLTVKLINI